MNHTCKVYRQFMFPVADRLACSTEEIALSDILGNLILYLLCDSDYMLILIFKFCWGLIMTVDHKPENFFLCRTLSSEMILRQSHLNVLRCSLPL